MKIHVFLGPTLSVDEAKKELDAVYLPPARMGDVYRAALERPAAIAIIDGVFEQTPAVSHKEVLWAMSEGVHVFGAASMGALRAVELAPFGMEGVGTVFDAFRRGELTDDDEVAVAHAPAELGYRRLSEAMVDVRATLARAREQGVVDDATHDLVARAAKGLFYPDRCWPLILVEARKLGVDGAAAQALLGFVRTQQVSQKRDDALTLLRALRARFADVVPPKRVAYHFERTDAWEHIKSLAKRTPRGGETAQVPDGTDHLLRALAAQGTLESALTGALARALAVDMVERQGRSFEGQALSDAVEAFRRARGLLAPEDVARWLADNEVRDPERFFRAEAQLQWVRTMAAAEARRHLPDHLRSTGQYAELVRPAHGTPSS